MPHSEEVKEVHNLLSREQYDQTDLLMEGVDSGLPVEALQWIIAEQEVSVVLASISFGF